MNVFSKEFLKKILTYNIILFEILQFFLKKENPKECRDYLWNNGRA